ncbi:MAG: hypothetical protein ACI9DJ_000011 [Algoriphagus sp.]|jgi:hypothetical protein
MNRINFIEKETLELRTILKNHELYNLLSNVDDIKTFMEKHVYAVWDFMSLLKAIQNHLTCTSIPWKPVKNAKTSRFINEIVFGEESDLNEEHIPKSHFEMYIEAMNEVNADSSRIMNLVNSVNFLGEIDDKLSKANLKTAEREFLKFTFDTIQSNEIHKIASAFTFGREDLIPDMFIEIISNADQKGENKFPKLSYYLKRHIELDGDEHGPLSLEMVSELCGEDDKKWVEVLETAKEALRQRINLWNEISKEIKEKEAVYA